eukprot:TRINITY_DN1520_c0_g1_i1.p1 TRINITY_DN1520_c0_g1~~TRINITY_DN1520_c0_g1_i1.p1  ORF type:complete len:324 (+),score=66.26 TRINITY_DN1520_c0_g1_i1:301-1272(+)
MVNSKDKAVFVCENISLPRKFYELVAKVLFTKFLVAKIFFVPALSLPLYLTGLQTGIVVECGFVCTQIAPFYEGFPLTRALKNVRASGAALTEKLRELLVEDNPDKKPSFFLQRLLDEIEAKYITVPTRRQIDEYMKDEATIQEMRAKVYEYHSSGKAVKISYLTRLLATTALFGDVDNDEPNIAYAFCQSLAQTDINCVRKVCRNVILSGGCAMLKGFVKRFRTEVVDFLTGRPEFERLRHLKDEIRVKSLNFFSSTLVWVGASASGSLIGVDRFMVTSATYTAAEGKLPLLMSDFLFEYEREKVQRPVSYTHLTLPTIYSV